METGLGGRLDATNAVDRPTLCVITSISLDHMEYLGNTVELIAGEKAGIIKPGVPVVYDSTDPAAAAVIRDRARELKSPARAVGTDSFSESVLKDGHLFIRKNGEEPLEIPFAAQYQAVNAMLAVQAAEILGIPERAVREGLQKTVWPGRMEERKAQTEPFPFVPATWISRILSRESPIAFIIARISSRLCFSLENFGIPSRYCSASLQASGLYSSPLPAPVLLFSVILSSFFILSDSVLLWPGKAMLKQNAPEADRTESRLLRFYSFVHLSIII